jgi:hypothetical protein
MVDGNVFINRLVIFVFVVSQFHNHPFLRNMTAGSDKFERLPTFAKPENYRIHLEPDLENFTANGRVDILINVCFII